MRPPPVDALPVLYIKPWCPWCHAALRLLRAHGLEVDVRDVTVDRDAFRRMVAVSHQSLTPTIEHRGRVLADFGPADLERFIAAGHLGAAAGASGEAATPS